MSERTLAIVRIGGRLEFGRAEILIAAINDTPVFGHEGDTYYQPRSVEDLIAALDETGRLQLTDDSAPWGEMVAVTTACRELGLSYRVWHEAASDCGAEVTWWMPGMSGPERAPSEHTTPSAVLFDVRHAQSALEALHANDVVTAINILEKVTPCIEPPRFEVLTSTVIAAVSVVEEPAAQSGG